MWVRRAGSAQMCSRHCQFLELALGRGAAYQLILSGRRRLGVALVVVGGGCRLGGCSLFFSRVKPKAVSSHGRGTQVWSTTSSTRGVWRCASAGAFSCWVSSSWQKRVWMRARGRQGLRISRCGRGEADGVGSGKLLVGAEAAEDGHEVVRAILYIDKCYDHVNHRTPWLWVFSRQLCCFCATRCLLRCSQVARMCWAVHKEAPATAAAVVAYDDCQR